MTGTTTLCRRPGGSACEGQWGFVDARQRWEIPPTFRHLGVYGVTRANQGDAAGFYAVVSSSDGWSNDDIPWTIVDATGKARIPDGFLPDRDHGCHEGVCAVRAP